MINHTKGTSVIKYARKKLICKAKKITETLSSRAWEGETCFIIGGGTSLENFDWNQLQGFRTIGINKAFIRYHAEVNFAMDYLFFDKVNSAQSFGFPDDKLHEEWLKYQGIKIFVRHDQNYIFSKDVYYVNELTRKAISFDLDEGIWPGNNSGMGALMLAVALGCKRIGLLGYDFYIKGSQTHWHEGYYQQNKKSLAVNLINYRRCIEEFASPISELGIQVFNLNPESKLRNFPFLDIKTFRQENS